MLGPLKDPGVEGEEENWLSLDLALSNALLLEPNFGVYKLSKPELISMLFPWEPPLPKFPPDLLLPIPIPRSMFLFIPIPPELFLLDIPPLLKFPPIPPIPPIPMPPPSL